MKNRTKAFIISFNIPNSAATNIAFIASFPALLAILTEAFFAISLLITFFALFSASSIFFESAANLSFNLFSFSALRLCFSASEISFLSIFLLALSTCSFRFFSLTSLSFIYSLLDFAPLLLLSDSLVAAKFSFLFAKSAVSISAIFLQGFSKICLRATT